MINCHNPSTTNHLINSATSCNNNITNINPYVNHASNNNSQNNTQRLLLGQGDGNYPFPVNNLAGANSNLAASNFGHTTASSTSTEKTGINYVGVHQNINSVINSNNNGHYPNNMIFNQYEPIT